MSTRPRDPRTRRRFAHPPHVYRRRRFVVVVVLCLVVLAAITLWPDGGETTPTSAGTEPTAERSAASPDPKPQVKPQSGVVRVHMSTPKAACNPRKVSVEPSVAPHTRAGGTVPIRLAISTSAKRACTLDLNADSLLLEVSDADDADEDEDAVWDSAACQEVPEQSVTLQPTWASVVTTSWSGREASKNCAKQGDLVPPAEYIVKAAVLGGEPGESTFSLSERPEPKRSDTSDEDQADGDQADGDERDRASGDERDRASGSRKPDGPQAGEAG